MQPVPDRADRLRARLDRLTIAVFLLVLTAPAVDQVVRTARERGPHEIEKREPARRPWLPTSLEELTQYPRAFDDWYVDWFGLRDKFLRWGSAIKVLVFGQSPTPTVDIGRDLWMFYTGEKSMPAFRGRLPFSDKELAGWQAMLENHARVCGELGTTSLFVIGPNKETIYPEYVPSGWTKVGPTRLEQLHAWLGAHEGSDTHMLDLRPALVAAKVEDVPGDFVYCEYGTHWNGRGCYVAYREIMTALQQRFPAVAPLPLSRFARAEGVDQGDSWTHSMNLDDLLPQRRVLLSGRTIEVATVMDNGVPVHSTRGGDPAGPRVVMFHDSFGSSILHMLAQHFPRMVCRESQFDEALFARERPDVVLEVFVERVLIRHGPSFPPIGNGALSQTFFDRAVDRLFELTAANAATAFECKGAVRVRTQDGDVVARLQVAEAPAYVVMPRLPNLHGDVLLHLEIESSTATQLHVSLAPGDQGPATDAWATIRAGTNSLWMRLPRTTGESQLVLHPGAVGEYALRVLEARQSQRDTR